MEPQPRSDHARIASERCLPYAVAQHHDVAPARRSGIRLSERAPKGWWHSEQVEVVAGDQLAERMRAVNPALIVRVGECIAHQIVPCTQRKEPRPAELMRFLTL